MTSNPHRLDVAVDVLSTLGAVFWSIQLLPQIVVNYRRKTGDGLQPSMMLAWALAGLPLGIHNILGRQPIALQVQAQILTALSLLTWAQVMYYDHKWTARRCFTLFVSFSFVFAAVQLAFIFGFRYGTSDDAIRRRAVLSMGILAGVGLCLGVLRQHYDVIRHRSVRGIAWEFVALDAAGDLTSLLSVVLRPPADRVAAAIYASELALWILMMIAGVVFNLRFYFQRRLRSTSPSHHQATAEDEQDQPSERRRSIDSVSSAFSRVRPNGERRSAWALRRIGFSRGGMDV